MFGFITRYWSWRQRREAVTHHRNNQALKVGRRRFNSFSALPSYPLHTWMWWRYKSTDEAGLVAYIMSQRWTGFIAYTVVHGAFTPISNDDPVYVIVANLDSELVQYQYARFRLTFSEFSNFFQNHSELYLQDVRFVEGALCWKKYGF